MSESSVQVTQGSGTRLRTATRTVASQTVHEEYMQVGEADLPSYSIVTAYGISAATANSHLLQIMAGSSARVALRRLMLYQVAAASSAQNSDLQLVRLTTAGTGGTAITPAPLATSDSAASASAMSLPSSKGTESTILHRQPVYFLQTLGASLTGPWPLMLDLDFERLRLKPPIIAAGTANGLALKCVGAVTSATVVVVAHITELPY